MSFLKFYLNIIFFILVFIFQASSEVIEKINVDGNQRISDKTIILFSGVNIGQKILDKDLNLILKDLYNTKYFEDINLLVENNILNIIVKEYPLIQTINYNGIKSNTILEKITADKLLKDKSPYNLFSLKNEKDRILYKIRDLGYYNASLETSVETLDENLVTINFDIILGDKAKIKKITFIGNKVFKDNKLKRLIASS